MFCFFFFFFWSHLPSLGKKKETEHKMSKQRHIEEIIESSICTTSAEQFLLGALGEDSVVAIFAVLCFDAALLEVLAAWWCTAAGWNARSLSRFLAAVRKPARLLS
uniref:Putative secreted protein ovary overexpressed n=1 Tax=Rhipicephalus microplus TaxID=6941 RepID=A0A6M2D937_RHIMP